MESTKKQLENVHIGITKDNKLVFIGTIDDKKDDWNLDSLVERTSEFLAVLFRFCPVGKSTFLAENDGKTGFLITIKKIDNTKPKSNIIH